MFRLLPLPVLLTGCRSCAERRADRAEARAMDELLPALQVETVEVWAEQVEREDGGVEAWSAGQSVELRAPMGWTLTALATAPAWTYELEDGDCADDVPLAWLDTFGDTTATATDERSVSWPSMAGGCDVSGDDIRGEYDAGYTLDVVATDDDGDSYELVLVVPVDLTIE